VQWSTDAAERGREPRASPVTELVAVHAVPKSRVDPRRGCAALGGRERPVSQKTSIHRAKGRTASSMGPQTRST
jgi:hypothetical protein